MERLIDLFFDQLNNHWRWPWCRLTWQMAIAVMCWSVQVYLHNNTNQKNTLKHLCVHTGANFDTGLIIRSFLLDDSSMSWLIDFVPSSSFSSIMSGAINMATSLIIRSTCWIIVPHRSASRMRLRSSGQNWYVMAKKASKWAQMDWIDVISKAQSPRKTWVDQNTLGSILTRRQWRPLTKSDSVRSKILSNQRRHWRRLI